VKQGDALSCVLFIMCMEPLLRNIEENPAIECIVSNVLGPLPKAYAYADDVNAVIANSPVCVQQLFNEYAKLTEVSGLELNADKTEIMRLNGRHRNQISFDIEYAGYNYQIETIAEIKINGILFQQDEKQLIEANIDSVLRKIDAQMKKWSARHLSILGKILIVKTFGISQIVYVMQSLVLSKEHLKKLNSLLYKFIWNRHYLASKAPERIKREIANKPLKLGGLGMLDLSMLDKSLKLKALARLSTSSHPFLRKIFEKINLSDFFYPKINFDLERMSHEGIKILKEIRLQLFRENSVANNRMYISYLRNIKLDNVVSQIGRGSIAFFDIRRLGCRMVGELDPNLLRRLEPFIERTIYSELKRAVIIRLDLNQLENWQLPFVRRGKFVNMVKLTSKEIREALAPVEPTCIFKFGAICSPSQSLTWGHNLSKVSSVRHKSCLLRIAHGDVYTKDKLYRFGLIDNPNCTRCGQPEDLQHKFITCLYVDLIWKETFALISRLSNIDLTEDRRNLVLGIVKGVCPLTLSIQAEVLQRILYLKDDSDFLLRPKAIAIRALELVANRERNRELKERIKSVLTEQE
jgi:hypothetical protein